ncbi:MAG: hypothetical protein JRF50_16020 [Deltaproteobacteria bacterium]|nr:hypothetical protein [Deltaproteobacteria bacterium]
MRETTRKKIEEAIKGGAKTYEQIREVSGVSRKAISEYKKSEYKKSEPPRPVSEPAGRQPEIVFFGVDDRKGHYNQETGELEQSLDSEITSEYPAWSQDGQIEDLKESIVSKKRILQGLATGRASKSFVPPEQIPRMKEELKREEGKLDRIVASKPKIKGKDQDNLKKVYDALGNEIRDAMFSASQMHYGRGLGVEEARRMTEARMDLKNIPGMTRELARSLNLRVTPDGKCSRNTLEKAWKTIGSLLGEATNSETLRRENITVRTQR